MTSRARGVTAVAVCLVLRASVAGVQAEEAGSAPAAVRPSDFLQRLNGTRWAIELSPMFERQPLQDADDTLSFHGGRLSSERLGADFPPAELTVTVDEHGAAAWEATQLHQERGILLWQGELDGATIRGIVSQHPLAGSSSDFIFIGQEVTDIPSDAPQPGSAATSP